MRNQEKTLKLGLFVTLAIAIFILLLYFVGNQEGFFASNGKLHVAFKDAQGLMIGDNVRYNGMNVGTVKDIKMVSDSSLVGTLSIRKQYFKFINKDSKVKVSMHGLTGGKVLQIMAGNASSGRVTDNDYLQVADNPGLDEILGGVYGMLKETTTVVNSIQSIVHKIDNGEGDIGRFINEDALHGDLENVLGQAEQMLTEMKLITQKINNGENDIAQLLNSDKLTTELNELLSNLAITAGDAQSLLKAIEEVAHSLNHGEGVLPRLLNDKQLGIKIDSTLSKTELGIEEITKAAEGLSGSWIVRMFSKKKKPKEVEKTEIVEPVETCD